MWVPQSPRHHPESGSMGAASVILCPLCATSLGMRRSWDHLRPCSHRSGLCWGPSCPMCPLALVITPGGCSPPEPGPGQPLGKDNLCATSCSAASPAPVADTCPSPTPTSPDDAEVLRKRALLLHSCHRRGGGTSSVHSHGGTLMAGGSPGLVDLTWSHPCCFLPPSSCSPGLNQPWRSQRSYKRWEGREGAVPLPTRPVTKLIPSS